jgi:DNA-directed RNA polymerase specialized sigma24 family protein
VVAVTYTSHAHKEGRWWIVQNDQVPGAISQVTRLDQAAEAQREAIAFVGEVKADSVEVLVRVSISPEIDKEVEEASALRAEAQQQEQRATEMRRAVALRLEAAGYTIRDIGVVLGVSYQRVHQLTHTTDRPGLENASELERDRA